MQLGVWLIGSIIFLGGCASSKVGVIRIDGSSQKSTQQSLQQLSGSLQNHDRCLLRAAILRIQIGDVGQWSASHGEQSDKSNPLGSMIDGMTYPQIIELSQRYPDKAGNACAPRAMHSLSKSRLARRCRRR